MGLLTGILTLPLAPVRGAVWVAEQVRHQAERQHFDPLVIQRELAEVDEAYEAGELTETQRDDLQEQLLGRLFEAQRRRRAGEV
ncbi:gas vesicle protein GvpG [Parasphingorhabdus pacifica]